MIKTGIDLVQISRIADKINNHSGFLDIILTEREQSYCKAKAKSVDTETKRYQSVAGIYGAKEAFYKAIGCGIKSLDYFKYIEICHDNNGSPYIKIIEKTNGIQEFSLIKNISISISHDGDNAVAVCIMEI